MRDEPRLLWAEVLELAQGFVLWECATFELMVAFKECFRTVLLLFTATSCQEHYIKNHDTVHILDIVGNASNLHQNGILLIVQTASDWQLVTFFR